MSSTKTESGKSRERRQPFDPTAQRFESTLVKTMLLLRAGQVDRHALEVRELAVRDRGRHGSRESQHRKQLRRVPDTFYMV